MTTNGRFWVTPEDTAAHVVPRCCYHTHMATNCFLCGSPTHDRLLLCGHHRWLLRQKPRRDAARVVRAMEFAAGKHRPGPRATGSQKAAYKSALLRYRQLLAALGVRFPATDARTHRIGQRRLG